jgi:hypothetical protein
MGWSRWYLPMRVIRGWKNAMKLRVCSGMSPCVLASAGHWIKILPGGNLVDKAEQLKASVRARVEHPFRVLKCQFGFTKVRYKGLAKNTSQLMTLFALSNLWMARGMLLNRPKA